MRQSGNRFARRSVRSYFSSARSCCHRWWYRYCLRPAASVPTAWMWPLGYGQIQTLFQAGGMTSSSMRDKVSGSVAGVPSASR